MPWPGGDLSGFSLPRATLKFSGEAPCNTRYYMELEFGHPGFAVLSPIHYLVQNYPEPFLLQWYNYSNTREAWIEWGCNEALNFRMGQIKTPNTRQLMVPPELQQFIDISMASALTDRFTHARSMPRRSLSRWYSSRRWSRLMTLGSTTSTRSRVVKRRPHSSHSRRLRISSPSRARRVSMTRFPSSEQKGQRTDQS